MATLRRERVPVFTEEREGGTLGYGEYSFCTVVHCADFGGL
jgi:hypothetical protein